MNNTHNEAMMLSEEQGLDLFIRDVDDLSDDASTISTPQLEQEKHAEGKPSNKRFTSRPSRFFELLDPAVAAEANGYMELDLSTMKCIVCGSPNHTASQCRYHNGDRRCYFCGSFNHSIETCPDSFCKKCFSFGHSHFDCHTDRSSVISNYLDLCDVKCWRCEAYSDKLSNHVKKILSYPHTHLNCPLALDPMCFCCGSTDHCTLDCDTPRRNKGYAICTFCGRNAHVYTECSQFRPSRDSPIPDRHWMRDIVFQAQAQAPPQKTRFKKSVAPKPSSFSDQRSNRNKYDYKKENSPFEQFKPSKFEADLKDYNQRRGAAANARRSHSFNERSSSRSNNDSRKTVSGRASYQKDDSSSKTRFSRKK